MGVSFRRWQIATAIIGLLFVVVGASDLVFCRRVLVEVPAPGDWQSWPVAPDLAGFTIESSTQPDPRGYPTGLAAPELREPAVCPRCGIPLGRWFDAQRIYGTRSQIAVRARGDTFVVTGERSMISTASKEPAFVAAFERRDGHLRPALRERLGETSALAFALAALVVGGLVARRRLRRAAELLDRARYVPGTLRGARLELDADPETYVVRGATAAGGRVLVRAPERGDTGYRTTRSVDGADILAIDPATVRGVADLRASEALRVAVWAAVIAATIAGVEASEAWFAKSGPWMF